MTYDKCPKCGGEVETEKNTMTGRLIREYYCVSCKWSDFVDEGPAMWKILSNESEDEE